jgi:hypothetical protein
MPEEIQTTVKVPISEIVAALRNKHELPSKLVAVRLEANKIVLNFAETGGEPLEMTKTDEPIRAKAHASEPLEEEAMTEEQIEIPEPMSEESMVTEEERERRRFGRK